MSAAVSTPQGQSPGVTTMVLLRKDCGSLLKNKSEVTDLHVPPSWSFITATPGFPGGGRVPGVNPALNHTGKKPVAQSSFFL